MKTQLNAFLNCVVDPGTLFAMFYVGYVVKLVNPHLRWFDRLLDYRPVFDATFTAMHASSTPRKKDSDCALIDGSSSSQLRNTIP